MPSLSGALTLVQGGFSSITARHEQKGADTMCVRYRPGDGATLAREVALLRHVRKHLPVPQVHTHEGELAIMSWMPGERVDTVLERQPEHAVEVARACGEMLARVHAIGSERAGFFDEQLRIVEPLEPAASALRAYMLECLEHPNCARHGLDKRRAASVRGLLERAAPIFARWDASCTLVHADYNTKNLLARQDAQGRWHVSAVLDWEFAMSGCPMLDVGNFLRFSHELPDEVACAFLKGYGMRECERARALGALFDLTALLSFLEREVLSALTQATVLSALDRTLERLSGRALQALL